MFSLIYAVNWFLQPNYILRQQPILEIYTVHEPKFMIERVVHVWLCLFKSGRTDMHNGFWSHMTSQSL